jgi:hypothetical protein
LAIDRVLRPAAANRTIRARFKSRCNVVGEREHASSTLRSFLERWTSLASGIIPILNHDSPSKKRGYYAFLPPCSPQFAANLPRFCTDPPGFDRTAFHRDFDASIVRFFREHLVGDGGTR